MNIPNNDDSVLKSGGRATHVKGLAALVACALALSGCGSTHETTNVAASAPAGSTGSGSGSGNAGHKPTPGSAGPVDTGEEPADGPAATEASPESPAQGPASTGDLSDADRSAVTAAVREYVAALDGHDAARVCALIASGGLPLGDLPRRRGGCRSSLRASIGSRPPGGGPAWRRTRIVQMKPEALGDDRARVTTTVTHHFSDRTYVSVEDDVIYLERVGGRWLIAKPSGTLYRAVGYPQPPLLALTPPRGW